MILCDETGVLGDDASHDVREDFHELRGVGRVADSLFIFAVGDWLGFDWGGIHSCFRHEIINFLLMGGIMGE